jgi:hypothetical protein
MDIAADGGADEHGAIGYFNYRGILIQNPCVTRLQCNCNLTMLTSYPGGRPSSINFLFALPIIQLNARGPPILLGRATNLSFDRGDPKPLSWTMIG